MSAFCEFEALKTESDVEQKFIWPMLTSPLPIGLGYETSEVITKRDIRKLEIGKGAGRKLYYPDYVIVIHGLPCLVIEAKDPDENIDTAVGEARLYATELNARFPSFENPCLYTVVSNGKTTRVQSWDSDAPICQFSFEDANSATVEFGRFVELLGHTILRKHALKQLQRLQKPLYVRPVNLAGGESVRNEELATNTFGSSLVLNYRHVFNPSTRLERKYIAQNAYVPSKRREQYVQNIDRVIRAASPKSVSDARLVEDTSKPSEITGKFKDLKRLQQQVLLLIGSVGAGKSTFVDYLEDVALPDSVKAGTVWIHLDLNSAPVNREEIYRWVLDDLQIKLPEACSTVDVESSEGLIKLYGPEVQKFNRAMSSFFEVGSIEHRTRLAEELIRLRNDGLVTVKALERHLCSERGRLLVVVLDNCDKRSRDEQLLMFEVAKWIQGTIRCLVVLPLRDVTYENHRSEPPLDTALKDLVFRIEPPTFQRVLHKRVLLALNELKQARGNVRTLSFTLKNGLRVDYPADDLAMFLTSIMTSVYEHDSFVRRMLTGIAGRDMRKAMEIFLQFCSSGYIDEAEILKIITSEGRHVLSYDLVARVLFRMNRVFYNGDESFVKNIFQCFPSDPVPNHFIRAGILLWLWDKRALRGPNGVRGYHRTSDVLEALIEKGIGYDRALEEILYLLKSGCVIAEHQQADTISEDDLICISSAGYVHLDLIKDPNYLAACAEDTWFADAVIAEQIHKRIITKKWRFAAHTVRANAGDFVRYLRKQTGEFNPDTSIYINQSGESWESFLGAAGQTKRSKEESSEE